MRISCIILKISSHFVIKYQDRLKNAGWVTNYSVLPWNYRIVRYIFCHELSFSMKNSKHFNFQIWMFFPSLYRTLLLKETNKVLKWPRTSYPLRYRLFNNIAFSVCIYHYMVHLYYHFVLTVNNILYVHMYHIC